MEDQKLKEFTQKLLNKFNLYRTRKQEISEDLRDEWEQMLGKLLVAYGAQDILRAGDSCVMRLGHFPTPADLYRFLPEQSEENWSERGLPEYRRAVFAYSSFCRETYRQIDPHAQGRVDDLILLAKEKNVNPKDALSRDIFKTLLCLKTELLADQRAFNATQQAHVES